MISPRHTGNHSSGELLTVAPWAVKKLPGVFSKQYQLMFGASPVNSMHFAQIVN